jgi:hypothetical protein
VFTVRHIDANGHESIREAKSITSNPGGGERIVTCRDAGGIGESFTDGILYVMNEAGKTVAKYDLGPPLAGARAVEDVSEKFPEGVIRG